MAFEAFAPSDRLPYDVPAVPGVRTACSTAPRHTAPAVCTSAALMLLGAVLLSGAWIATTPASASSLAAAHVGPAPRTVGGVGVGPVAAGLAQRRRPPLSAPPQALAQAPWHPAPSALSAASEAGPSAWLWLHPQHVPLAVAGLIIAFFRVFRHVAKKEAIGGLDLRFKVRLQPGPGRPLGPVDLYEGGGAPRECPPDMRMCAVGEQEVSDREEGARRAKGKGRIRQHVNPLLRRFQEPLDLPEDWLAQHFEDPTRPFWIDIGCAFGGFAMDVGAARPDLNVLGLEIRDPVVEKALRVRDERGLRNVHFVACSANANIDQVLEAVQRYSRVERVLIQMPDPWFKRRHHNRRVTTPQLLRSIAGALPPDGRLFVQSDVLDVAAQMRRELEACARLQDLTEPEGEVFEAKGHAWLCVNPNGFSTERERYVLNQDLPVYRALYGRK